MKFKPDLPPMKGSDSNSFPLEARKNEGVILENIIPSFSVPEVRASREKITSNMTAFIGGKSGFKKAIIHIHTYYSFDCNVKPAKIVDQAVKMGIDFLLITDHDSLNGSIEAANYSKQKGFSIEIPVAAEYTTNIGDLIVFGVTPDFQKQKDYVQLCRTAKEQGAFTILPHPFKSHRLDKVNFEWIDGIEVYNSRCSDQENLLAFDLARQLGKPMVYGSDAHTLADLGNAIFNYQGDTIFHGQTNPIRLLSTPWQRIEYSRCIRGFKLRKPKEVLRGIKRSLIHVLIHTK